MNSQGPRWLSNVQLTQYQGLLLKNTRISLETVCTLNPATFLPTEEEDPEHDYIEVINEVYVTRPDLRESPHPNPDIILYTDGSSFLRDGNVTWANIYTDFRYAFATIHIRGAIYKERGLLTAEGKAIKNKQEILKLLQAIWLPQHVAVIYCQGHQRGNEPLAVRNRLADTTAKSESMGSPSELLLVTNITTTSLLQYTKELRWAKSEVATRLPQVWWQLPDGRLFIPALLGPQVTAEYHKLTHLGKISLEGLLAKNFYISHLSALCKSIGERCLTCAKNNPKSGPSPIPGIQRSSTAHFEDLEVDFTDMINCRGTKYLLVLVCTYSGWFEAFPTQTEKSHEVAKILLRELIPHYGISLSIHNDNGTAFIAELLGPEGAMGINQSHGHQLETSHNIPTTKLRKVECMNRILNETLAKLHQETSLGWVDLLPLAILRARCTPGKSGFSPSKIMFKRPPPLLTSLPGDIHHLGFSSLQNQMAALGKVLTDVRAYILERALISLGALVHPFILGTQVWVKDWMCEPLRPRWTGPHTVMFVTSTALKVSGIAPWIHHTRVKKAQPEDDAWIVQPELAHPLRLTLKKQTG
ncbi:hypothetical protein mRhiFer1_008380 [Rhinolophus ferrumequinum]|uniref:Uncharacterized protein n=1 Tax=Rhinolophus ferrumequinum TaxID=59479 RepID=A0A7J7VE17_RHIFE|nr:hypothetical protein mRhiFer1_008380 [Rhinolophus ferrumequinum]